MGNRKKTYKGKKLYAILSTIVFLIIICLPLSNHIFHFSDKQEISKSEKRVLATKPKLDIQKPDSFPMAYEAYFNDHFIHREKLLQLHTYIYFFWYKQSPLPEKVDLGKDSWLFYTEKERAVYEGTFKLNSIEIDKIVDELNRRDSILQSMNIPFVILIAPTKAEIYSDQLPSYYRRTGKTFTQEIIENIQNRTKIPVVYPKEALTKAKKKFQTYHQFDNHWNQLGAFFAYSELMQKIKKHFPNLKIKMLKMEDVKLKKEITNGGNLANMIGLDHLLKETNYTFEVKNKKATDAPKQNYKPISGFAYPNEYETVSEIKNSNLSKALIIRDSYINAMMPYLNESFSKSSYIFDAWQYKLNDEILKNESPDIFILEIYEPHISNILDNLE